MSRGSELRESDVWTLGALQCVLWGCLYYSFPLLLPGMAADLGAGKIVISGAFSFGLLVAAGAAPWVGRRLDRGAAISVLRLGGWGAVVGLALWSRAQTVAALYVAWGLIGAAMAAGLYESTFSLVMRTAPSARVAARRLATVTLAGGLASVVFAPWITEIVERRDWRLALLAAAATTAIAMTLAEGLVLRGAALAPWPARDAGSVPTRRAAIAAVMLAGAVGSFASVAVATHLVPALRERGASAQQAAFGLALLGLAQLPGRYLLRNVAHRLSLVAWLVVPGALQLVGLAGLALDLPRIFAVSAIVCFGLGSGLQTLARPLLSQQVFGLAAVSRGSGSLVSAQNLSRAAAPVAVATGAVRVGYGAVFAAIAFAWGAVCVVSLVSEPRRAAR